MIDHLLRYLHNLRLRTKITLGMTGMLVFCGLGIGLTLSAMSSEALLEEGKKRGLAMTSGLAFRLTEPLLAMDFLQMSNLLTDVYRQYDDIIYVFLTDANANVLSHTFSGGFPSDLLQISHDEQDGRPLLLATEQGRVYDFSARIALDEKTLGLVRLGLDRSVIDAQIKRQQLTSLFSTLVVVGLGIILSLWFAHTVTFRLNRLRTSVEEIVTGNLDVHAGFPLDRYCWQIMNCDQQNCPAYGDKQRRCWYLAGTMCPNCRGDEYPFKMENCRQCQVFRHNFGDELQDLAEAFDAMAVTVKKHIEELTERERTIARQQGVLKTIVNVTPDFITLQDRELRYTFAGKAFCDYFNLTEEEVIGKTDFEIFSASRARKNTEEDRQILLSGRPLAKEVSIKRAGEHYWFHVVKVPVFDQDGSIMGILLSGRDITMLKKYQEQLIQSQKLEDLGRLAGGVAHEINTPLGIILGYTQLLMDDIEDEELLEGMKIIEKQTKVCRKIVADLLGYSRQSHSVIGAVDINESIREVIALVEHAFFLNRISVTFLADDAMKLLHGDKERLKQVWLNLLNNAADAIDQDGVIIVRTRFLPETQRMEVSVTDTGKGVAKQHLDKLFDPFFTTKQVGKGTGLGLSVSIGIIKDHGGTISAVSPAPPSYLHEEPANPAQAGPGTVFIVSLPVHPAKEMATLESGVTG